MANALARKLVHIVADTRKSHYKKVSQLAKHTKYKKILELGSGPLVKGKYYYSAKHLFENKNEFVQSDIDKSFGHPIIDVVKMKYKSEFDLILCLNVLEHVYEYEKGLANMHAALKKGGKLILAVPAFYPLHDEPHDYWRFTEHALRKMLVNYSIVKLSFNGKRQFPFGYYIEAVK